MYNTIKKVISLFMSLLILYSMTVPAFAASNDYRLTGNEADDIISVAVAQNGLTADDFGFSGNWCGKFLSWCAERAGSTHVSTKITGGLSSITQEIENGLGEFYCFSDSKTNITGQSIYDYLHSNNIFTISNTGLSRVNEVSRDNFVPRKGDIIVILWSNDYEPNEPQFSHVGLVRSDYDGKGTVYTVEGNTSNGRVALKSRSYRDTQIVGFVRPYYKNSVSGIDVTTDAAKNIAENSANVSGSYYNPSGLKVTEYGIQYGTSKSNLSLKGSLKRNESHVNGGIPAYTLKNLSTGTTYYYRCYVVAGGKTYYGDIKSFKTKAVLTVTSDNATNITQNTAVISGSYHNPNQDKVTEYGIQYGTNKSNLNQTGALKRNETVVNGGIPAYTLKNLKPGTTYYYRCYVKADGRTYVGATKSFTTAKAPEPATLSTNTSSITLDLSKNKSKTISLTLGGGLPDPCQVAVFYDTKGVNIKWGEYSDGLLVPAIITGKQIGNYTIKFVVWHRDTKEIAVSKTVTVKVTAPTYTIKFDANGGSGAPSAQTKTYQKNLTIPATIPTRNNYKFLGWSTTKDGSVQYQPGQQFTTDKNMTLYAVWEGGGYIGEAWFVESYDISLEDEFLEVGDSTKIIADAILNTGKAVNWTSRFQFTSSDPSVARVSGNSIEALKPGTTYIEGEYSGLDELCRLKLVVIEPQPEKVWIDFAQHERTVYTDDIEGFKIGFSTNASSDAEYTWTLTGDASVNMPSPDTFSGASSPTIEVNESKAGEAVLTVQVRQDGQTATDSCVIRVERREESVIEISPNPVITPASGYNQGVDISFSDEPARCEATLTSSETGEVVEEYTFTKFYLNQSNDPPYETSFSLTGLPDGDYILKLEVEYEDGSIQNESAALTRYTEIVGDGVELHRVTVK